MSDPATIPASTILYGGEPVPVKYKDGRSENAHVQLLPVDKYPLYFATLNEEHRNSELLCDKPRGWAEELTPESIIAIVEKGESLNFSLVQRWADRRLRIAQAAAGTEQAIAQLT